METTETQPKTKRTKKTIFTYDEVVASATKYFAGDQLAATTWINKYAMRNKNGELVEATPDAMHKRMAKEFARIEKKYEQKKNASAMEKLSLYGQNRNALDQDKIYSLFKDFRYGIPQGSVMASLGNSHVIASLSNCVVIPPTYDSYGGICYSDQQLAQLFKRRCGVGVDISGLRPKNLYVSNAAGTTTGAVSFMERFSNTTREVAQNGRRGALMLTIDIAHPDVEDFVTIKQDLTKVTGANISIRLSDEFMKAVVEDSDFTLRFPIDSPTPSYKKTIQARELWNTVIECAHQTAEPGLIFWDRQHHYSTSSVYPDFKNDSTNPCSEIAMQGGDSCRLMAINLYSFVKDPFTDKATFDYEHFYEVSYEMQRLMDDLVDLELESVSRILEKVESDDEPEFIKSTERETWQTLYEQGKKGRRTGLGFTALADAVAALGLAFDADEAISEIERIMKTKLRGEFDSSIDMAITRGSFEGFDPKVEQTSEFVDMLAQEFGEIHDRMMTYGRRNVSISTVAPTGTLSMLAQTSSGIEPVYMLSYMRRRKVNKDADPAVVKFVDDLGDAWEEFTVHHPKLETWIKNHPDQEIESSPYHGSTAPEIDWMKRVQVQALVQKYVTHSISSTINLPSDVSVDRVGEIYIESWKQGLKGITVYRDGSRTGVLVSTDDKKKDKEEIPTLSVPKRPKKIEADIIRFQNDYEKWISVVGLIDNKPYEIFTGNIENSFQLPLYVEKGWVIKERNEEGKSRYDFQFRDKDGYRVTVEGLSRSFDKEYWNYAKLISGVLRHGMDIKNVVELINDLNMNDTSINTWKNGVARALKRYIPDGTKVKQTDLEGDICEVASSEQGKEVACDYIYEEGCVKCLVCGNTKCG